MIYIILPVYNRKGKTLMFVECLLSQTYKDYQLILIDDGSTDGTSDDVFLKMPEAVIIKGNGNWWWAGSLQQGYNWLKQNQTNPNDLILLINDDTEFDPNFLEEALRIVRQNERTLVKSLARDNETMKFSDGYIHADLKKLKFTETDDISQANCTSTRGLFCRVADFFEIGGFVPDKLPHYLSDYEYTIRAYRMGFKIITDKKLYLYADFKSTGIQNNKGLAFSRYVKNLFSYRNAGHPGHWINFICITSENWFYKYINILKVILWAINNLLISIIKSFSLLKEKVRT
jgi:GT2 family glycosyltransferase